MLQIFSDTYVVGVSRDYLAGLLVSTRNRCSDEVITVANFLWQLLHD